MAEVFDLAARRLTNPADAVSITRALAENASGLHNEFTRWPVTFVRESHVIGAERQLVEMQRLLIELRAFVPATEYRA